jgi:photosystem II stability/assembly factor-like uncharacterized protein
MLFALVLACSSASAQYIWRVKHSDRIGSIQYTMTAIDCYGSTCTVAAQKLDLSNNDRLDLIFFRSDDNGETWIEQDPGLAPIKNSIDRLWQIQQIDSLNAIAVGGYTTDGQFILRTTDAGTTWQRQYTDTAKYYATSVSFSDSSHGIITHAGWDQISITTDAGQDWSDVAPSIPGPNQCVAISADSFMVFSEFTQKLYSTSNNWQRIDSSGIIGPLGTDSVGYVYDFCNFGANGRISTYGSSYYNDSSGPSINNGLIVLTSDGGNTWSVSSSTTEPLIVTAMTSLAADTVFAAGESNDTMLLSTDHGVSWFPDSMRLDTTNFLPYFCNGLATTRDGHIIGLFVNGGFAGSQAAIFRREPVEAGVNLPEQPAMLTQVFPNPASSSIIVTSFQAGSTVRLLDMIGRVVLQKVVPVGNALTLDVSSIPSGLYYIDDGVIHAKFVKE